MLSEQQLIKHNANITGSKVASILGLNPKRSKWQLFCEMHGDIEIEKIEGINLRMGNYAEKAFDEFVINEYGWEVQEIPEGREHPQYPFLFGLIDRMGNDKDGNIFIVEYKNFDKDYKMRWEKVGNSLVIPNHIQCQIYFYMILWDLPAKLLAVFGGNDPQLFDIPRNQEIEDFILGECLKFWDDLQNDRYPDVDGTAGCTETLKRMYPTATENMIDGDLDLLGVAIQRQLISKEIAELEARKAELDNKFRLLIAENQGINFGMNGYVSNKMTSPKTMKFDDKRFCIEEPELCKKYLSLPGGYKVLRYNIK